MAYRLLILSLEQTLINALDTLGEIVKRILILLVAGFLSSPTLAEKTDNAKWRTTMRELSKALSETIPYLYPDPSLDEKNLTKKVRKIYDLTQTLDVKTAHAMKVPDADPILPYMASMFRQEIERAYLSIQDGHVEYGKGVLRSSVSYCITCHTRSKTGAQFPVLSAFEKPLARASWIEKLEFQTASRQYDAVLNEVMGQLKNPGPVGISAIDLERGARMALSILVRLNKDPDRAMMLANAMGVSPAATVSMKEAAKVWAKDIRVWQDERERKFKGADEILAEARTLSAGTNSRTEHTEVRHLRATALLHDFLQSSPPDVQAAEALYLTGRSYNELGEIGMWSLHEFYYVACIDKVPHSALAEACFKAYDQSMVLGYSGSSGLHLPKAIREHLTRLKTKAEVKTTSAPKL